MNATPTFSAPFETMADYANHQPRNQHGRLQGDEKLLVTFYNRPVYSELKSREEGRPIYDDLPHIKILVPGDDRLVFDTIVIPEYIQRFPLDWERFEKQHTVAETGTPLDQWPALSTAQVQEFKHFNVHTVEALADLPDSLGTKFPGFYGLRDKAKAWLKVAADNAVVERQDAQLAERDAKITALEEKLNALLEATAKKGK